MSPDSPETRLGRLETAVARLEQRTDDLSTDVRTLTPLIVQVAEIKITIAQVQLEARGTHDAVESVKRLIEEERRTREAIREKEREEAKRVESDRKKEASTERRWRLLLLATVLLGIFAAFVTIGVAVLG